MTSALSAPHITRSPLAYVQVGLALLAAAVFGFRAVLTALGQGVPQTGTGAHLFGASVAGGAGALAVAGAMLVLTGCRRPAVITLAVALVLELFVVDLVATPPRLVTALPLGLALVLFLASRHTSAGDPQPHFAGGPEAGPPAPASALRTAAAVVALVLMLPVGFQYLMSGLVVPVPDLFGMYALFAALFAGAALLARRRSWWVLALPPLSAGLWFLLITIGGRFWGWQP